MNLKFKNIHPPTDGKLIAALCSAQTSENCAQDLFVLSAKVVDISGTTNLYNIELKFDAGNRHSNFLLHLSFCPALSTMGIRMDQSLDNVNYFKRFYWE